MRLRLALSVVVAILTGVGSVMYFTAPPPPAAAAPALPRLTRGAAHPPQPAPTQHVPSAHRAETEAMRKRFESAPNYAAFIHDAIQRPLEGGRFYAVLAYHRCEELAGIEAKHFSQHEQSERRDKAITVIEDLMQRCEGVKAHFPDIGVIMRRLNIANAKGTPDTLLIERGLLKQTEKKEAFNDLLRARATGDPYLIAVTLELNVDHYASLSGKGYVPEAHQSALHVAAAAAVCEITNTCVRNLQLQMMCAAGGHCDHSDFRDHLRDGMTADELRQFEAMRLALLTLAAQGR